MKKEWIMVLILDVQYSADPPSLKIDISDNVNVISIVFNHILIFNTQMTPGDREPSWVADVTIETHHQPLHMLVALGFFCDICLDIESITTVKIDGGITMNVVAIGEPEISARLIE
jgi:hypothetical protein